MTSYNITYMGNMMGGSTGFSGFNGIDIFGSGGGLLGFMTHPFQSIMFGIGIILLAVICYKILMN